MIFNSKLSLTQSKEKARTTMKIAKSSKVKLQTSGQNSLQTKSLFLTIKISSKIEKTAVSLQSTSKKMLMLNL